MIFNLCNHSGGGITTTLTPTKKRNICTNVTLLLILLFPAILLANTDNLLTTGFTGNYDYTIIGNTESTGEASGQCGENNGTSRYLSIPGGATVAAAYLYWSGSSNYGGGSVYIDTDVSLNGITVNASNTYTQTINASGTYLDFYGASADVTSLVNGSGTITINNLTWDRSIACSFGSVYGGWALLVVYEDASLPNNTINIYETFTGLWNNGNSFDQSHTLSGFTIPDCQADIELTSVIWDGDAYKGEYTYVHGTYFGDNLLSGYNSFDGTSNYNLDIDLKDLDGVVPAGTTSFQYKTTSYSSGSGTEFHIDQLFVLKFTNCAEQIIPPTDPTCQSGDILWDNNITVNGTTVTGDVRLKSGGTTIYTLPITLPSEFINGPVTVDVSEAISWDGYSGRASTGDQPNERWKVVFFKNGTKVGESNYTVDGIATGQESAEWLGSLGANIQLPNGADQIKLVHWSNATYGENDNSNPNSIYPSSVCISYTVSCDNVTNGGLIGPNSSYCGSSVNPPTINNISAPSGGSGNLEIIWLKSTTSCEVPTDINDPNWTIIAGATGLTYNPPTIYESTCYVRCSRREGCTDYDGESNVVSIILSPDMTISGSVSDVTCHGYDNGSIDITVTGGTSPYDYSWSNGATTQDISGLSAGEYTVTVTDDAGCEKTKKYTVSQPSKLDISGVVTDVTCHGYDNGSIDITVTGGTSPYDYSWSNGATTQDISGLSAGEYTVTVTDDAGCEKTKKYTVSQPSKLDISGVVTDVTCHGYDNGSIDITVTGGTSPYDYSWSNGATTQDISGLSAGEYAVTVTDDNGCTKSKKFDVGEPDPLAISGVVADVTCHGYDNGSIDITVTGGTSPYDYLWSNGATTQDISGLSAGEYAVTVTDDNGCTKSKKFDVGEPDPLAISGVVADVTCHGYDNGSIDITVTGGTSPYDYLWSNGATTQDISGLVRENMR